MADIRQYGMSIGCRFLLCIALTVGFLPAHARELRVPAQYLTIEDAFHDLESGDTILVAPGVYVESLVAPPLDFVMRGETRVDSEAAELAIIDPSDLPGSDTLLTFRLTGGIARFQDIVFRNRGSMIADRPQSDESGIKGDTNVVSVTFERCLFDSLISAVSRVDLINVSKCRFNGCRGAVFTGSWRGHLNADSTWFDGFGGLVDTQEGCLIRDCLFTYAGSSALFVAVGDSVIIDKCRFVGTGSSAVLRIRPRCGSQISNCIFEDIRSWNGALVAIRVVCGEDPVGEECASKSSTISSYAAEVRQAALCHEAR